SAFSQLEYVKLFHIRKYGRFTLSKGVDPGTGPGVLPGGDPGCLLPATQRPVYCLGSGGIPYLSIFPNSFPLIAGFRHRTRGITYAHKSTGVAHSQQDFPRQDIAPVILLSWVPLRQEPHSEPGGGPMEKVGASDGVLETAEPGALVISEEEACGGFPFISQGQREAVAKLIMGVPRRFRWVTFLVSKEALRHSRVWGNVVRLPVSAIYEEHQKVKTRKRSPLYTPPPRLARATTLVNGLSSTSSTGAEAVPNHDPLVDAHRRLIGELGVKHDASPGSVDSASEGVGKMGAHEGMAGEAIGTLGSRRRVSSTYVPVRGDRPAVGEFLSGSLPEIIVGSDSRRILLSE
ncbi:hypothetical protein HID58_048322, partial [Brassica napus]